MWLKSIQTRLILAVGLCVIIILGALAVITGNNLRQQVIARAEINLHAQAQALAGKISAIIDNSLESGLTTSQFMSQMKDENSPLYTDRDTAIAILRSILEVNPAFFSVFMSWKPNAFDGFDFVFTGAPGHDADGRFIPTLHRHDEHKIELSCLAETRQAVDNHWFKKTMSQDTPLITSPYVSPTCNKKIRVISVLVPIIFKGERLGLTGVSIRVDMLQDMINREVAQIESGESLLNMFTEDGTIVASSASPELSGQPISSLREKDWQEDLKIIREGAQAIQHHEDNLELYSPVTFSHSNQTWSINISVPTSLVTDKADSLMIKQGIIGLLLTLLLLVFIWIISRRITRPIIELATVARLIGEGKTAHVTVQGHDEVATLASEFNRMIAKRNAAVDKIRESEKQLSKILDGMPMGFVIIDPERYKIIRVNSEACKMFGLTEQEIVGQRCQHFFCPTELDKCPVTDQGLEIDHSERMLHTADGEEIHIIKTVARTEIGGREMLLESFVNISEQKDLEMALRQAKEKAEKSAQKLNLYAKELNQNNIKLDKALDAAHEASKAKSEFLANMSHEIRTPLNAIIGFSDMALETELNDEQQDFLESVTQAGKVLLGLINDILDFSKIEAGKLEIDATSFDLNQMFATLQSIHAMKALEGNVTVHFKTPTFKYHVISDPLRLQQILTNLLGNSLKFTSKGNVTLTVAEKEQSESYQVTFSVSDTGIGIAKEKKQSIFESFSQADGSVTRNFGGTGLGLAISNQLLGLLGGESLQVESELGKGSTFFFTLELQKGEKIDYEKVKPSEAAPEEKTDQSYNILLVEDNLVNIKLARAVLGKRGHKVTVAENGKLGLEAVEQHKFDLVLMDMQMPVMDGLQATRAIREWEAQHPSVRKLPIIAMTANAMTGDREKCLAAGMDDYTSKPIKINELTQAMAHCMGISHKSPASHPPVSARILMAEDNPVNAKMLSTQLTKHGHSVEVAKNGLEAVEFFKNDEFELILMDIQMPVMDGIEATRLIREIEKQNGTKNHIPIVAVSAHAMEKECLEAGMDKCFPKPVRIGEINPVIASLVSRQDG